MKKLSIIILFGGVILFARSSAYAQDSRTTSAAKQISKTSEQSEDLFGKKIQQETLSIKPLKNLDCVVDNKSKKKTCTRHKRKHK